MAKNFISVVRLGASIPVSAPAYYATRNKSFGTSSIQFLQRWNKDDGDYYIKLKYCLWHIIHETNACYLYYVVSGVFDSEAERNPFLPSGNQRCAKDAWCQKVNKPEIKHGLWDMAESNKITPKRSRPDLETHSFIHFVAHNCHLQARYIQFFFWQCV